MKELYLTADMIQRIENLYNEMEMAYDKVATELHFGCQGCPDNCCDSYFLHYTYLEWSYLWVGVSELSQEKQDGIIERAHNYIIEAEKNIRENKRPQIMCPLNEAGLCTVYKHRLMVCRTHGVPAKLTRPDGKALRFPGCFRCQELVEKKGDSPEVDRTSMLRELAAMEGEYLENKRHLHPKVKMTIAQMLVVGPPKLKIPHCQR